MPAMDSQIAVQDTYPEDFSHCYGCGRLNPAGYQIKTFEDENGTVTNFEPASIHTGGLEFAYGGIIASVIDCHSTGSAAVFWMQREGRAVGGQTAPRFVTARLEVDYLAPTPLASFRLRGTADEIGDRKVVVVTELAAGGKVTARGRAVLVRIAAP